MAEYFFDSSNVRLNYFCNDIESDKTILFVHGWTGGWEVWKPVIKEFNDYKIYAVDLPGHNKSGHLESYNIETYYPPLVEFANFIPEKQIILVGHSLGSASSMYIAGELNNKVTHLLLEDPPWFKETKIERINYEDEDDDRSHQTKFFLENKPKWRTALDAIFDFQIFDPDLFLTNPYWAAVRASYAFHHDINIWNVESDWIWQDAPMLAKNINSKTILLGGNIDKGGLMMESVAKKVQQNINDCQIEYWDTGHGVRSEKPEEYSKLLRKLIS